MVRRTLAMILVVLMVLTFAVGCGKNSDTPTAKDDSTGAPPAETQSTAEQPKEDDPAEKGGKLVGLIGQGRGEEAAKPAIEAFKKKYPKWEVEVSAVADLEQKVKIALGAKEDLDFFWSGGSDYPRIWGEQNAVVPLDEYLEKEGINLYDVYEKPYVDELKYQGKQVILPTDCFTYALWYNKVVFDKAKVPYPKYNESYTWEQFLDVAKKCTMDTDGDGKIDTWGISLYTPVWHIVQPFYNSFGARMVSPDGMKATGFIDSPEFKAFLTQYSDMLNKYKIARPLNIAPDADSWTETWTNGFLSGSCAMLVGAPWTINEADKMEQEHPEKFKWGTTLVPRFGNKENPVAIGGTAGYAIPITCPEEKRLMAFRLAWELSAGEGAKWWYDQTLMYSTKEGLAKFTESDKEKYGGWTEMVKYLVPMEQISVPAWKDAVEPALKDSVSKAFLGKMSVDDAVKKAAEAIDRGITEYEAGK